MFAAEAFDAESARQLALLEQLAARRACRGHAHRSRRTSRIPRRRPRWGARAHRWGARAAARWPWRGAEM